MRTMLYYIRKTFLYFMPYGVIKKVRENNKRKELTNGFVYLYNAFLRSDRRKSFIPSKADFCVVSVEGTGFSGSSAVVDLLREYDNTMCIGAISDETANIESITNNYEVDFLRLAGGLFEIERYIGTNNIFQNDAVLQRFIKMAESFPIFRKEAIIQDAFFRFFMAITEQFYCEMTYPSYNSHLYEKNAGPYYIFYLRNMLVDEYRGIARQFICEILAFFNPNGKILVLDQFCNDLSHDIEKYLDYIPNLKIIHVYRDPRAVYEYAKSANVQWISHNKVEHFINWYKIMSIKTYLFDTSHILCVRFENLVNDYTDTTKEVEKFLDIPEVMHTNKKVFFNPEISKRNVSKWKENVAIKDDVKVICSELSNYCYD